MRTIRNVLLALIGVGLAIQLVPYGRAHTNPPITGEPDWDSPRTRELFFRVCRDCHSNQTEWPWYASVAPSSWLVQHDVDEGREHFNVDEWGRKKNDGDEAAEMVREGEMPPWFYLPLHPESQLTDAEGANLVAGLVATFGDEAAESHGDGRDR